MGKYFLFPGDQILGLGGYETLPGRRYAVMEERREHLQVYLLAQDVEMSEATARERGELMMKDKW